jgi:chromosome segregation ATPase
MRPIRMGLAGCALLLLLSSALAERKRDPLTIPEIDQLRETATEPDLRLKLYVKFARARLASLEQARSDPKTTDRGLETHDRLQDFLDVYDEMNENIDTYVGRKSDLRKVLKTVIEADTEFQARIRALQDAANTAKDEARQYEFLLSNALETLDSSAQDHRQLLSEQEEAAKHKKAAKP